MDIDKINRTIGKAIQSFQFDEIEEIATTFEGLDEAYDKGLGGKKKSQGTEMYCNECEKRFRKKIGPKTVGGEVKCPKCGGYDVEPAAYFGH